MTRSVADLSQRLIAGDRRALAKAITLIESTRPEDRARAETLLTEALPHTGKAVRIGLSGTPGAGKSTFIEAFGTHLTGQGRRVAVLAVDPSSRRSGGSILGDKTRMERLARDPAAFIRPSPSSGELGGVARRTREVMLAVEAAGFDTVLVETVGVGQSETAVADMTDMFVLIHAPGGGDELQGIKRGIMELADLVLVNKADGDLLPAARRAAADVSAALHLMRPKHKGWSPPVLQVSALEDRGVAAVWVEIERFRTTLGESGLGDLRQAQARAWMWADVRDGLLHALAADAGIAEEAQRLEGEVAAGRLTAPKAAQTLLKRFLEP
ncbi:putative GTPase [Alphaproteobacteria bacterium SO-S41]|nr:putative GTPase [Alphaproteobacteria bacterium SO-S41]